jgi:hypothetical protein
MQKAQQVPGNPADGGALQAMELHFLDSYSFQIEVEFTIRTFVELILACPSTSVNLGSRLRISHPPVFALTRSIY